MKSVVIRYKHALAHLEDTIVDKFGKNQTTDIRYNKGDYVFRLGSFVYYFT